MFQPTSQWKRLGAMEQKSLWHSASTVLMQAVEHRMGQALSVMLVRRSQLLLVKCY